MYDGIGEAIRRFVQARNLTITFSDSVNENTANIETHTHTHTETLFVASGELVVSTGIRDQLRIGAGQAVTITKGTAHSIRFDRPRTVYVYARHLDEEDMIDVKGGISQQEFLHETECDRLVEFQKKEHVKAMKEKNNDIARLRSQLVDAKNQIEKLFAYKKNLKRKFDQIVDNWPQETGEIAET